MARTATPSCTASDAIADQIAWIDAAPIPDAVHAVMALAGTVDGARTDVVDAKTRLIRKACADGYSVRKVAEMMGVSPGYVQRLKTQR